MTKTELKHEFRLYYADLKAAAKREGFKVDRTYEAEQFIATKIDNDELPATAASWTI